MILVGGVIVFINLYALVLCIAARGVFNLVIGFLSFVVKNLQDTFLDHAFQITLYGSSRPSDMFGNVTEMNPANAIFCSMGF